MTIAVLISNGEEKGGRALVVVQIDPGTPLPEGPQMKRETSYLYPGETRTFHIHRHVQLVICEAP